MKLEVAVLAESLCKTEGAVQRSYESNELEGLVGGTMEWWTEKRDMKDWNYKIDAYTNKDVISIEFNMKTKQMTKHVWAFARYSLGKSSVGET